MTFRRLSSGGSIDRGKSLSFTLDGRRYRGFAGDTLASALLANDVRLIGRSFKYHRPRGIVSAGVEEPNALFTLHDGARTEANAPGTMVELVDGLQARTGEGPGVDSWRRGQPVRVPRLANCAERWPRDSELAADLDIHGAYALPVAVRDQPVGTLTLLVNGPREIPAEDLTVAASLAGVAVGAILRWRPGPLRSSDISTRIQSVISARAALETATGMLTAQHDLSVADAARALEDYARRNGTPCRAKWFQSANARFARSPTTDGRSDRQRAVGGRPARRCHSADGARARVPRRRRPTMT